MNGDVSNADRASQAGGGEKNMMPSTRERRWQFWSIEQRTVRWFMAEIAVVVAGVLIALAMNSWWQTRRDRDVEQGYLRAIVSDLDSTSISLERAIRTNEKAYRSITMLLGASLDPTTAPHDSVVVWTRNVQFLSLASYGVGSARAMVANGDLQLIREDSIRLAVSRVLDYVDRAREAELLLFNLMNPPMERIGRKTVSLEFYADLNRIAPSASVPVDSIMLRAIRSRRHSAGTSVEETMSSEDSRKDLLTLLDATQALLAWRKQTLARMTGARTRIASAMKTR